ncbi:hypothetical protein Hanom_Chr09g00795891 [Helianthus anomalus]
MIIIINQNSKPLPSPLSKTAKTHPSRKSLSTLFINSRQRRSQTHMLNLNQSLKASVGSALCSEPLASPPRMVNISSL